MRLRLLAAATAMLAFSLAAHAEAFNFSFTGGDTASGTINASATTIAGQYLATSITGVINGVSIQSLLNVNTYGGNDNLLYFPATGGTFFDGGGISVLLSDGTDANLFYGATTNGDIGYFIAEGSSLSVNAQDTVSVAAAATPEPSSLALLGTGVLGVIGAARRRFAA